jgi:hypothetical protein
VRFRRRRSKRALDEEAVEHALNMEALEHVLSGRDIFEGSPFYEKLTPEDGQEVELMFGRAGTAVALYVLQLPDKPEEGLEILAATSMFADAAAKAVPSALSEE